MRLCSVLGLQRGRWRRGLRLVVDETGIVRENRKGGNPGIAFCVHHAVRRRRIAVVCSNARWLDQTDDPCVNTSLDMAESCIASTSQSSFWKQEFDIAGWVKLLTHIEMRNVNTRYNSGTSTKNRCPPVIHALEKLENCLPVYY